MGQLKKKTIAAYALLGSMVVCLAVAYWIGAYFVDYALKRGNDSDPMALPAACERIQDKGRTVPAQPAAPSEDWGLAAKDGRHLAGTHFLPEKSGHCWAILVHGYGRDQRYAGDYAAEYLARGYHVLTPDLCASGKSEGQFITMGVRESEEIALWTKKVRNYDPEARIVLHGVSMGAATVLMSAAREDTVNIVAVIEDCGYTSAYKMFSDQLGVIFGLPPFPIMSFVDVVSGIKTGARLSEAAPIDAMNRLKVPVLFIHGEKDRLVPIHMMEEMYTACPTMKAKLVVDGAGHGYAMKQDKKTYWDTIFGFLDVLEGENEGNTSGRKSN